MGRPFISSNCSITLQKRGSRTYAKVSFPLHCGVFTEVRTDECVLHFNLNNEIIRAQGLGSDWLHPHEWLKRSAGNDWVYYSTGGYTGVFEATGEYYLPNFRYSSNNLLGGRPFANEAISDLTESWHNKLQRIRSQISSSSVEIDDFLNAALQHDAQTLAGKGAMVHEIIGGPISVLPPDARHVDYNLIPLTISEGCLYKCRFCKVKNHSPFTEHTAPAIQAQLHSLKTLYGRDLYNYNSVFLGQHDALNCSPDTIVNAINAAVHQLGLESSYPGGSNIFFFGSVSSLLAAPETFFDRLNRLSSMVYINIGLESADQATLEAIGKPITEQMVRDAFLRIQAINDQYPALEISANFIMDDSLPADHYPKIVGLIRDSLRHRKPKGSIYFSPLTFDQPSRARLFAFNRLKILSRLPTFLYIIQRL